VQASCAPNRVESTWLSPAADADGDSPGWASALAGTAHALNKVKDTAVRGRMEHVMRLLEKERAGEAVGKHTRASAVVVTSYVQIRTLRDRDSSC
jgi:hypothetical protein